MNEDDLHCHFILTHRVDPYNLEYNRMIQHKKPLHETVLSDAERKTIMSRCDTLDAFGDDEDDDDDDEEGGLMFGHTCGSDSDYDDDDEPELNYNELFKKRKQSAMTQEEIMELADVFKKPAEAMCISKLHF